MREALQSANRQKERAETAERAAEDATRAGQRCASYHHREAVPCPCLRAGSVQLFEPQNETGVAFGSPSDWWKDYVRVHETLTSRGGLCSLW